MGRVGRVGGESGRVSDWERVRLGRVGESGESEWGESEREWGE